jgi:cobalt-zinc-cadmium efflux system outer membrane protein
MLISSSCSRVTCIGIALVMGSPLAAQGDRAPAASVRLEGVSRAIPITLRDVLARVRDEHPLAQAASARVDAARGSRTTAGGFGNPVLQYNIENAPLPGRASIPMDREARTAAMIPLEALYQRAPRVARADADVRAAQADARSQVIQLSLDAARAYFRVAVAQIGVDITRDLGVWLDSVVTYNRARVKEGIAAEADLIRAQLEQDRAAAELSMQEADLAQERATLASYLGTPSAGTPIVVAITDRPLQWRTTELGDSLGAAPSLQLASLERQPRVQAAQERVTSTSAGVGVERRMIVRDLSATVGTKQTAGITSLMAGVSVPLPLFNFNRGEIVRATAEQRVAELELAAAQRSGWAELTGAYEAARVLTDRITQLAAAPAGVQTTTPALLSRADESRSIALGAYREGIVPLLSVLDAARAWGEVRQAFYRALYAQHESVLTLGAALGIEPQTMLSSSTSAPRVPR